MVAGDTKAFYEIVSNARVSKIIVVANLCEFFQWFSTNITELYIELYMYLSLYFFVYPLERKSIFSYHLSHYFFKISKIFFQIK